jgi:hypothetical protein
MCNVQIVKTPEEEERLKAKEAKRRLGKPHAQGFPEWGNRLAFTEHQETRFATSPQLLDFTFSGRDPVADAMVLLLGLAAAQRKTPQSRVTITYTNSVAGKDAGRCGGARLAIGAAQLASHRMRCRACSSRWLVRHTLAGRRTEPSYTAASAVRSQTKPASLMTSTRRWARPSVGSTAGFSNGLGGVS